uniref:Histone H2A/H2B/H3 domain-containing protein n=1 Tax=Suricata suricatta TaxID=37032 RepID=A0A673TFK3_SURSU
MPEPTKSAPALKKGSKEAVAKAQKKDGKKRKRGRKENYSHLRVQGAQAGAPRHRHLVQSRGHHELVRQRHLRAHRRRGLPPGAIQQAHHRHVPGGQTAVRLLLPGELAKHAVSEGTKAVTKHTGSNCSFAVFRPG